MQMRENAFKQSISKGNSQLGLWVSLCSNYATECVATAGYDWVLLDMEPVSYTHLTLPTICSV